MPINFESYPTGASIPFLGRKDELEQFRYFIDFDRVDSPVRRLIVSGDSGTGKSCFVKEALFRLMSESEAYYFVLYVDLSNDEFQSSRLLSSLLKLATLPAKPSPSYPLAIPKGLTLSDYHSKYTDRISLGWNVMKGVSHAAASFFGLGDTVESAFQSAGVARNSPDDILTHYFDWVRRKVPIILVIDNYQFMNYEVRLTLESVVQRIGKNIRFVIVDRTINGLSEISPPLQALSVDDHSIKMIHFTKDETRALVEATINADAATIEALSLDIFTKTGGLAKDIEFCLKRYQLATDGSPEKSDILGLLATVDRLPLIHRQLLLVASMLDGGIHTDIAKSAMQRVGAIVHDNDIDHILSELIALEYLKLNTDTGERIRAGHERIVQAMHDLATDDLYDDVRRSLIEEFSNVLKRQNYRENEAYLLHCLVGLQTAAELRQNLHYISRLVRTQYRQEQFAYLVTLTDEVKEIIPLLQQEIISLLLDSMQKSSAFERGLQILQHLDEHKVSGFSGRNLYRYKFLVQLYQYPEAAKIADKLDDNSWTVVYKVNALLALDRCNDARVLVEEAIAQDIKSEPQAVLLRNSITLFKPEIALKHLSISAAYFDNTDSAFRLATIDTNRSLVHLCQGELGEAARVLERAISLMHSVGSREVYQAYFNLGIKHGLAGKNDIALDTLETAASYVPSTLLLDKVKIDMSAIVFKYAAGRINSSDACEQLQYALSQIRGVYMPYLRRTLEYNLLVLGDSDEIIEHKLQSRFANRDNVSVYLPVAIRGKSPLLINPSIHWRY